MSLNTEIRKIEKEADIFKMLEDMAEYRGVSVDYAITGGAESAVLSRFTAETLPKRLPIHDIEKMAQRLCFTLEILCDGAYFSNFADDMKKAIKHAREKAGINSQDMADKVDLSRQAYGRYEIGYHSSAKTLLYIMREIKADFRIIMIKGCKTG